MDVKNSSGFPGDPTSWGDFYHNLTAYQLFPNETPFPTSLSADEMEIKLARQALYPPMVFLMVLFCFFAVAINVVVLVSVCWIRRPLSPTLQFSLSLAGADMYTSLLMAINLVVNSLTLILPKETPLEDLMNRDP